MLVLASPTTASFFPNSTGLATAEAPLFPNTNNQSDIERVAKPASNVPCEVGRRRQRRLTSRKLDYMQQLLQLTAGALLVLGAFLAVSRFTNDGTTLAEVRLRSRQATTDKKLGDLNAKDAALFLDNDSKINRENIKDDLPNLYKELDDLYECNRTLDTPLLRLLLNTSGSHKNEVDPKTLYLAGLIARHSYLSTECKTF